MREPIVILVSAKAQHGKDSFADAFIKEAEMKKLKCLKVKYGDVLKFVAEKYFNWSGKKDEVGRSLLQWLRNRFG